MARLAYTEGALEDLERLAEFLLAGQPREARATAKLILDGLRILESHPLIGRPLAGGRYELVISRGRTGYVALYEFAARLDRVLVVAVRHQREAGIEDDDI